MVSQRVRALILTRLWASTPCPAQIRAPADSVPSVSAFEGADSAFAAGSPFHGASERRSVFDRPSGLRGFASAGDHHVLDPEVVEVVFDLLLAVAAVGGHGAWRAAGALDDPLDRGRELGRVGGVALFDGVLQDHAIGVVDHLGLVTELDGLAQPALGDRASPASRPPGTGPGSWCGSRHRQPGSDGRRPRCAEPPWPAGPSRSGRPRCRAPPWCPPGSCSCAAAWPRQPWPTAPRSTPPPPPLHTVCSASSAWSGAAPPPPAGSGRTFAR